MNIKHKANSVGIRIFNRFAIGMCIIFGLIPSSHTAVGDEPQAQAQASPIKIVSIPAARQADRIAVITIEGVIDATTALSVRRRIKAAETAGMEAVVFEINSPGGELGAVLEISNEIKSSTIGNSVAWVRPDAHSGGAIIALACNEIITSSPASMGDAFVIQIQMLGMGGIHALTPEERTKFLPPLMADVTDSARRSGYDEYLVQAIVVDGIELWLVEDNETGQRTAINEEEYRLLFEGEVIRGKPMLATITGGVKTYQTEPADDDTNADTSADPAPDTDPDADSDAPAPTAPTKPTAAPPGHDNPTDYKPASPTLNDIDIAFDDAENGIILELASTRKMFTPADRGKYQLLGYITDGTSAIVMRDTQLQDFGFSSGIIQTDEELKAFFGADEMVRVRMNWSEKMVRFLTSVPVRGVLIVILLIALFVEMVMAGTGIAGAIAIGALVLILGPGAMVGLSGWWELIAIVIGVTCLAIEIFVMPGIGVFGVIGFVSLFAGLIGTFVTAGGSMSNPQMQQDLATGAMTVLLAFITAGIGWWLIIKNAQNLPLFDKFILTSASGVGGMPQKSLLHAIVPDDGSIKIGSEGITTTPLHPVGQADFNGQLEDVHASFGVIDKGVPVRVISATQMRIEVEIIEPDETQPTQEHPKDNQTKDALDG